jgi:hypothetical protein
MLLSLNGLGAGFSPRGTDLLFRTHRTSSSSVSHWGLSRAWLVWAVGTFRGLGRHGMKADQMHPVVGRTRSDHAPIRQYA